MGLSPFVEADGRNAPQVSLRRSLEIHFVVKLGHGFLRGVAALECQFADAGIEFVGRFLSMSANACHAIKQGGSQGRAGKSSHCSLHRGFGIHGCACRGR
ncbi:hypothetical protein CDO26_05125 [Sinorhizobium meliloti]|nr:hypothetical protein CDO26_05125 [Sinorhizobium meliloti]